MDIPFRQEIIVFFQIRAVASKGSHFSPVVPHELLNALETNRTSGIDIIERQCGKCKLSMFLIVQQCIEQIIDLDLQLVYRAVGRHRDTGGHVLIAVVIIEPPFNGHVEGIGLELFFVIMEKSLNLVLIVLAPGRFRNQQLENRLQQHTLPAAVHQGNQRVGRPFLIAEVQNHIVILFEHLFIFKSGNPDPLNTRHGLPPPSPSRCARSVPSVPYNGQHHGTDNAFFHIILRGGKSASRSPR
ncbi:hypothetical protein D3C73_862270 [compost metagenome]